MGVLRLWRSVLRAILGRRRGAHGWFCRGIPGFLGCVWARRGDSAHGGHRRANLAKKFLKKEVKRAKNPEIGVREVLRGLIWASYIGCAGRFLDLEAQSLAALLEAQ